MNKTFFSTILSIVISLSGTCCAQNRQGESNGRPLVIAHRGGALIGNENSISCFEKGIASGADMIEIDVHQTADGQLVVCHDPTIDRTTNGKGVIEEMTLDSLRTFRILDFRSGEATDEKIPTLGEVLALAVSKNCPVLLEVKKKEGQYPGIEEAILRCVSDYDAKELLVYQSFNIDVLKTFHKLDNSIRLEYLTVFAPLKIGKYDFISSYNVHFPTKLFVKRCHKKGMEAKAWTVNKVDKYRKLNLDGIITNRPDLFTENR